MKRFLTFLLGLALLAPAILRADIAQNATRLTVAGLDVIVYPTGKDVVTIRGAFPAGDAFSGEGNIAIPTLCGMLLDAGTTRQNKFAIADQLDSVGASIEFSVGTQSVSVSAKCLAKDVALVISLIAEQLRTPAFSSEEFAKARTQFTGMLHRQMESTDARADEAFKQAIYAPGHPNRGNTSEEFLAAVETATLDEVKAFHAKYYGPAHFTLVLVGDIDRALAEKEIARAFNGWTGGVDFIKQAPLPVTDRKHEGTVFMNDKTSVSVMLGQATTLRYGDPDYFALQTATAILGSGFTSRLLGQVRDVEGLTYGIYSTLANDALTTGDWFIYATFAPSKINAGIESTRRHLRHWYDEGVTEKEFADRKTNLVGVYQVSLATTDGLAGALMQTVQRGKPLTWLDEYPKTIEALTLAQVNGAIKKHLKPDSMLLIQAGTVPGLAPVAK